MEEIKTAAQLYRYMKNQLKASGIEDFDLESRILLSYVLKEEPFFVYMKPEKPVSEEDVQKAMALTEKRKEGVPSRYLTRKAYFMDFEFYVDENVLIPRQDTEVLVQKALDFLKDNPKAKVLDIGTGSGCIAVSIALLNPACTVDATDISKEALAVARKNAVLNGAEKRVRFIESDLFSGLSDKYDMIVSNPPYIKPSEFLTLQKEVRCHEPVLALVADEEGLAFYRRIAKEAKSFLNDGGFLLFETGYDQARSVYRIMEEEGFTFLEITKDYNGIERVVSGRMNE
ncbi:MAG: peptide chain release factor N(5)-glutamine methyltransferase [Clostridiaceae bacterium]|nr:peptide chain release factor N(5)-glutamine methyltransferase [Clostridiaceae bacterium]